MSTSNAKRIMRDVLRGYFAPLTGAIKGIRAEYRRLDEEFSRRREKVLRESHGRAGH